MRPAFSFQSSSKWIKSSLDTLISYSPVGIAMQVAVALTVYGVLLL
jgi:hypothetical protein